MTLQIAGWLADAGWRVTLRTEPGGSSPHLRRFRERHPAVHVAEVKALGDAEVRSALVSDPWLSRLHASDRLAPQSVAFGMATSRFYDTELFDLTVVSFPPDLAGWTPRGQVLLNVFGLPPNREIADLERPLLEKSRHRTFASRFVQKEFAHLTGEGRGTILHAAVDEAFFTPWDSDPPDHDIVFAGRLVERKGVAVLLDSLQILKRERGLTARLAVAGEGPERGRLMRRSEDLGIADQVDWLGVLDTESLVRLLDRSRVFAYPTLRPEAFGCSVVEAMARRKAVVTTNLGGTADYVEPGRNAMVCRPGDADDLAGRLALVLMDHDLRVRLGKLAGETAKRFHPDRIKGKWVAYINGLFGERR